MSRKRGSLVSFPDRLNWKTAHSNLPTTSTPKVDGASRKVTKLDVETAFGFDDSWNDETAANYSTLISPIAVWKVNPLTQSNVEPEKRTPVTARRRSKRKCASSKSKKTQNINPVAPALFEDIVVEEPSVFTALLEKYHDDPTVGAEEGLHVDPKKIVKTYKKRVKMSKEKEIEYPTSRKPVDKQVRKKRKAFSKKKTQQQDQENEFEFDQKIKQWMEEKNKEFEDVLKAPLVIEENILCDGKF